MKERTLGSASQESLHDSHMMLQRLRRQKQDSSDTPEFQELWQPRKLKTDWRELSPEPSQKIAQLTV